MKLNAMQAGRWHNEFAMATGKFNCNSNNNYYSATANHLNSKNLPAFVRLTRSARALLLRLMASAYFLKLKLLKNATNFLYGNEKMGKKCIAKLAHANIRIVCIATKKKVV